MEALIRNTIIGFPSGGLQDSTQGHRNRDCNFSEYRVLLTRPRDNPALQYRYFSLKFSLTSC
jgi:hypothetical protein